MSSSPGGDWPPILDARQVAKILKVHPDTVWRWWREKVLPRLPAKPGFKWRMSARQLARWLDQRDDA